ncbi:MAG: hypothetical protein KJZ69_12885 [Phycisphaerales bacterium]|nr:hypothetical protein [Phycisphaerales bacterium]
MNSRNARSVDKVVALGTLGRMIAERTASGYGTGEIIAAPPVLVIDADRSGTGTAAGPGGEEGVHTIILREWTTGELVQVYESRPNLLPIAPIIEETGSDSTRFGVSGSPRRGDAVYTAEHEKLRRGFVEALRPVRERHSVAVRGLGHDAVSTSDRSVDIYMPANLAGGLANGTLVPAAIDIHEAAAQHGLGRARVFPYLVAPFPGNGANFATAAGAAISSLRQVSAACLRPDLIRDEKLAGTRIPHAPLFTEPTLLTGSNGRVTFAKRETPAAVAALDINLRGDSGFSSDSYFTDYRSRVNGAHIPHDAIWRAVGHTVIEFDPHRAAEVLEAVLTQEITWRLLEGMGSEQVPLPMCTVADLSALFESAERPSGTDVMTETYEALAGAGREAIEPTVQEAHDRLCSRASEYEQRLRALTEGFVTNHRTKVDRNIQHAVVARGLRETGNLLKAATDGQRKIAADYVTDAVAGVAAPPSSGADALLAQLRDLSRSASRASAAAATVGTVMTVMAVGCFGMGLSMLFGVLGALLGWGLVSAGVLLVGMAVTAKVWGSRYSVNRMRQVAVGAVNADFACFGSRINSIRMTVGRAALDRLVEHFERAWASYSREASEVKQSNTDAAGRLREMTSGSVPTEIPGIILPTTADAKVIIAQRLATRMDAMVNQIIAARAPGAGCMVERIRQQVRAEIGGMKLDDVGVIDFIERWPNAIDMDPFVAARIDESWPTAPLDHAAVPGYSPPILRVIRASGGVRDGGVLLERLRKHQAEEVNQVRHHDWGDPRRIIVTHDQRFISLRQVAYMAVLEAAAADLPQEMERFLTTCVPDPRALDIFRCGTIRDQAAAWDAFFCGTASGVVVRRGDNTYVLEDSALRGGLRMTDGDGRLAQGLTNMISRLTRDASLRRGLEEAFARTIQREGRTAAARKCLAAMAAGTNHVPAEAVAEFTETGLRAVCRLLPQCQTLEDAARLVGFAPQTGESSRSVDDQAPDEQPLRGGMEGHHVGLAGRQAGGARVPGSRREPKGQANGQAAPSRRNP